MQPQTTNHETNLDGERVTGALVRGAGRDCPAAGDGILKSETNQMSDKTQSKEGMQHDAAFEEWWDKEGSRIILLSRDDFSTYAKRVSQIAWLVSAKKVIEILQKP